MGMLTPTSLYATVTFLGLNTDGNDLSTVSANTVEVDYAGFVGDSHAGLTRASCTRVSRQYTKGTDIRNVRQVSALSAEEFEQIEQAMQVDALQPGWVGANLVVSGIPDFSKIPPSSRLIATNGTALVVDMENAPCRFPGDIIEQHLPGKGSAFPAAALNKRGTTMWVEREGTLAVGDSLRLHIPPVCSWTTP